MSRFTESVVEQAALAWLEAAGWQVAHGPEIAPPCLPAGRDTPVAERADYGEVVLTQRVRDALSQRNLALSTEAIEDALRSPARPDGGASVHGRRETVPAGGLPHGR